jgi:hypothetical protein
MIENISAIAIIMLIFIYFANTFVLSLLIDNLVYIKLANNTIIAIFRFWNISFSRFLRPYLYQQL